MTDKEALIKFAKELGYQYALPVADEEFQYFYICYTDSKMSLLKDVGIKALRKMKLGSPKVISIDKQNGLPYILDRGQFLELNDRFIASGKELHCHLKPEDYQCE